MSVLWVGEGGQKHTHNRIVPIEVPIEIFTSPHFTFSFQSHQEGLHGMITQQLCVMFSVVLFGSQAGLV